MPDISFIVVLQYKNSNDMKEVKQIHLNDNTGTQTVLLASDAKFLSVHYLGKIVVVYEQEKTEQAPLRRNFEFYIRASFDFVPDEGVYIGSIVYDHEMLHVYREP